MEAKQIAKIFSLLFVLVGLTAAITLVQERQDIREKAEMQCSGNGLCGMAAGCPEGYLCSPEGCIFNSACNYPYCPATDCNLPTSLPDAVYCIMSTSGRLTTCCPTDKPLYQNGKCVSLSGGGGGGGGSQAGCSSASAANCQGKNPGDSCGSGKICKALSQTGSDGKPKCSCTTSGGGGGGGGGGGTSCDKNPNPTVLSISNDGEVVIFFQSFLSSTPPKIAIKKNSETCSLTKYDQLIDTKDTTPEQPVKTNIQVKSGDKLCIYGEDIGTDAGPYPFEGWIEPKDNKCNDQDVSSLIQNAQNSGNKILSQECWGDYAKKADCDFNDYVLIVAAGKSTSASGGINLLFRQQGIVSAVKSEIPDQLNTRITLKKDGKISYQIEKAKPIVSDNGVWSVDISKDDQGNFISADIYDILVKGISHLQKKFENISINGNDQTIDKSQNSEDELKSGDANNDNFITIEDVSTVLKYYTDFSVPVDTSKADMVSADVNKDGKITIDDVALVALNWTDFIVPGNE
jgi:hypothetical protein